MNSIFELLGIGKRKFGLYSRLLFLTWLKWNVCVDLDLDFSFG